MNLDAASSLRVLVVGDAIIDRYVHTIALGRATKDPVLSAKYERTEEFRGGVWACAEHLKDFVSTVDVWHGNQLSINTKFVAQHGKLLSLHETHELVAGFEPDEIKSYDLVLVYDYGFGMFNAELRRRLMRESRFIAVNAQTNSINYGFNRINERWPMASLACCDEAEARLAAHEPEAPLTEILPRLPYPVSVVTQGSKGAIGYSSEQFYSSAAFTDHPRDLLGAGDAFLAVCAPFAAIGWGMGDLLRLGNAAAAVKVSIPGHSEYVTKEAVKGYL